MAAASTASGSMARCRTATGEQMLAPALRPGDIVIVDNLRAQPDSFADIPPGDPANGRMVAGIQEAITERSAELRYLPLCSPTSIHQAQSA